MICKLDPDNPEYQWLFTNQKVSYKLNRELKKEDDNMEFIGDLEYVDKIEARLIKELSELTGRKVTRITQFDGYEEIGEFE